jgi:hypothetical protein
MNGKQMEMKKNTTKNFGVKKEGGEEEEKVWNGNLAFQCKLINFGWP